MKKMFKSIKQKNRFYLRKKMDLRKKEEISKKKCFSSLMEGKREMSKIRLLKGIDLENQASIEEDIYQDEELVGF